MTISRRNFLRTGTMMSLSTIAALSAANLTFGQSIINSKSRRPEIFEVPREAYNSVLDKISKEMFDELVNSTFVVTHPEQGKLEVYLKEVEDLRPLGFKNNPQAGYECFNLVFVSQSGIELGQGTYMMEHAKLGEFELFVVPGVSQRYGRHYGAIINRLFP